MPPHAAEPPTAAPETAKISAPREAKPQSFQWSYSDEPHATRRKEMRKKYGKKISALEGIDPTIKYWVFAVFFIQMSCCYYTTQMSDSWLLYFATMYIVGGTLSNTCGLSLHEISHGLAFKNRKLNTLFGIFANLPLGIPISVSFRRYHLEHHTFQGEALVDSDIPSEWELRCFNNSFMKILWVIFNPVFYAIRPLFILPKTPGKLEVVNVIVQLAFDAVIWYFWGLKATLYFVFSTLLGLGLHPLAGHFIAEHYTFIKGQETYSYYGPLNFLMFNVGYHNEHHDFPRVPGSRLPALRALAPEYYDTLPHHMSYVQVLYNYIFDPEIGPWSRIKRQQLDDATLKKLQ